MSGARDIEERAALWLVRREEPDWTQVDEDSLQDWLDVSAAHKAAYWRLEHGWRAADRIGALGAAAGPAIRGQTVWNQWWKPLAAAAVLLLVFAFVLQASKLPFGRGRPDVQTASFATRIGDRKLIDLPDGSRVELNTATALRAEVGSGRRAIWLDRGEAYFDVVHREGHPFVVYAGPRTITVLGTKFAVRREGAKVVVTVAEGKVRIDDVIASAPVRSAIITAGDVAVTEGQSMLLAANSINRVEEQLAWRRNMLLFDSIALADAAAEFNRYNHKQLVIDDEATGQIRIGGSFQAKNVDAFARLLRQAYGLKVEVDEEKVTVSR